MVILRYKVKLRNTLEPPTLHYHWFPLRLAVTLLVYRCVNHFFCFICCWGGSAYVFFFFRFVY